MQRSIGPYRIVAETERTPFGARLDARDAGDRPVTLFVFAAGEVAESALERARRLAALAHPALSRTIDAGRLEDGRVYVVEEHTSAPRDGLSGLDLESAARLADGLSVLHGAGLVHGDLRRSTVARGADGRACLAGLPAGCSSVPRSPEEVRGEAAEPRSDLFAFAALLWEGWSGGAPFPGESEASVLYRLVNEVPAAADLDPGIATVLERALSKRRADRYQDADALAAALREHALDRVLDAPAASDAPAAAAPPDRTPPPVVTKRPPRRAGISLLAVAAVAIVAVVAGVAVLRTRDTVLPGAGPQDRAPTLAAARVRTEPPGLAVALDGVPLELGQEARVRYSPGAGATLSVETRCRSVEHVLDAADDGGEVVLVADPTTLEWRIDPGVAGARVALNGEDAGAAPQTLNLDLCEANEIRVVADGYRPSVVSVEAGATPLEARRGLFDLRLEPIPRGRLMLPQGRVQLVYYVDGERQPASLHSVELDAGTHRVRVKNEFHWLDRSVEVDVPAGASAEADLGSLSMAQLTVQAYPANCTVSLRHGSANWRSVGETPFTRAIDPGRYEVRVTSNTSSRSRTVKVTLEAGDNPPVRVSLGGDP